MDRLKYFMECYFHLNTGFNELDDIIEDFKNTENDICKLLFIRELHYFIQTKKYDVVARILKKYGSMVLDDLAEVEKFINFLFDRFIDRSTEVKASDFIKKSKSVLCPVCRPDPKAVMEFMNSSDLKAVLEFSWIEKATVIANELQIYICKSCKLVWPTEDIHADNAQSYKKFMKTLGFKGLWKELKDVDLL